MIFFCLFQMLFLFCKFISNFFVLVSIFSFFSSKTGCSSLCLKSFVLLTCIIRNWIKKRSKRDSFFFSSFRLLFVVWLEIWDAAGGGSRNQKYKKAKKNIDVSRLNVNVHTRRTLNVGWDATTPLHGLFVSSFVCLFDCLFVC